MGRPVGAPGSLDPNPLPFPGASVNQAGMRVGVCTVSTFWRRHLWWKVLLFTAALARLWQVLLCLAGCCDPGVHTSTWVG